MQAKLVDSPHDLRINACPQCVADFAKNGSMAIRVANKLENQLYTDVAGFRATAPAFCE